MLRMLFVTLMWSVLVQAAYAHELTPTYFDLKSSHKSGVIQTDLILFNRREDVLFYEVSVFDKNWNSIPFAAIKRIVEVEYLERKNIRLFLRGQDRERIMYVCTRSLLLSGSVESSGVSSRICSKRNSK